MLNIIGIGEEFILLYGNEQNKQTHRHYGLQLFIPHHELHINGITTQLPVLIDSYVPHYVYSYTKVFSLIIHPETNIGRAIRSAYLQENNIIYMHDCLLHRLIKHIHIHSYPSNIEQTTHKVIKYLLTNIRTVRPLDDRVREINKYIVASELHSLRYKDVVDRVALSTSRVRHLYKEQMGTSIMKYIMWQRLLHTSFELIRSDISITTAAHKYGFADAAHFSRTFKDNFGISPGHIFHKKVKNSRLVHVFTISPFVR